MDVALANQKVEINVEHDSSIGYKDVFHVIVLLRFVLVPNEISNKPFHNIAITAEFFQKITLAVEHVLILHG